MPIHLPHPAQDSRGKAPLKSGFWNCSREKWIQVQSILKTLTLKEACGKPDILAPILRLLARHRPLRVLRPGKAGCIRHSPPLDLEQARCLVTGFVDHYTTVRLHSAIGYITPPKKLLGKDKALFSARDQKLASSQLQRKINPQNQHAYSLTQPPAFFQWTLNQNKLSLHLQRRRGF